MPIPGRPPSLIQRPPGCAFHPRCPYVEEEHKRIVPPLVPAPGAPGHLHACLLPDERRAAIWARLAAGDTPDQALASVGTPTAPGSEA